MKRGSSILLLGYNLKTTVQLKISHPCRLRLLSPNFEPINFKFQPVYILLPLCVLGELNDTLALPEILKAFGTSPIVIESKRR